MSYAHTEVVALAARAARGVGAGARQASLFGAAAARHISAKRDPDVLVAALRTMPQGPIAQVPLLLLEAQNADGAACPWPADLDETLLASYAETAEFAVSLDVPRQLLRVEARPNTPVSTQRLDLPESLISLFREFEAHTFVPDSDASRISGAGAGLTDND